MINDTKYYLNKSKENQKLDTVILEYMKNNSLYDFVKENVKRKDTQIVESIRPYIKDKYLVDAPFL